MAAAKVVNFDKKMNMSAPKIAVFAGLGPKSVDALYDSTKKAGWTTIILGLFHIGDAARGFVEAEIFLNDLSIIRDGVYTADHAWPAKIAQLKASSSITEIYASIGGWDPVRDFKTIKEIYEKNHNSFEGTMLQKNFQVLRDKVPAIDGIDMDCEGNSGTDVYDKTSFVAFCKMLIGMGFAITFCPYEKPEFWVGALDEIENSKVIVNGVEKSARGAVKWWNLQCYDGGANNDPQTWASAIKAKIPEFPTDGFILASDWAKFWDKDRNQWRGDCPREVKQRISQYSKEACFGGAFIWNMDQIVDAETRKVKCDRSGLPPNTPGMWDYAEAIRVAMQSVTPS
jgi:hypothetical protein